LCANESSCTPFFWGPSLESPFVMSYLSI
jgi:hypothetical protein